MKIIVEIECDTIRELIAHLASAKNQIIAHCKEHKIDPDKSEFLNDVQFEDDNCYGSHKLIIVESNWKSVDND